MDGRHFGGGVRPPKEARRQGRRLKNNRPPLPPATARTAAMEAGEEVAKKGSGSSHKEDANIPGSQFKVVPSRKKGKK